MVFSSNLPSKSANSYASLSFFHLPRRFLKEKFHAHEYDIPLERVGHCQGPHYLSFLFEPLSLSYDPKCEGHPFKVKGITDINYVLMCCSFP